MGIFVGDDEHCFHCWQDMIHRIGDSIEDQCSAV